MDRDGTFITPHQIFSILLWHLAGTRKLPGDVAKTFSTTKLIDKIAAKFGRKVYEMPVGFKYICELMLERDILIGGEESGGIGTKLLSARARRHGHRSAARRSHGLARQIARRTGQASCTPNSASTTTAASILSLRDGQKQRAAPSNTSLIPSSTHWLDWPVVRREDLDGIKIYLGEIGWLMVRASGTEPMLRLYAETNSPATTRRLLEEATRTVKNL